MRGTSRMRAGKQFETLECPTDLQKLALEPGSTALLECMSNLTANEFFDGKAHTPQATAAKIMAGIASIREQCANLIVVTNEVFFGWCGVLMNGRRSIWNVLGASTAQWRAMQTAWQRSCMEFR